MNGQDLVELVKAHEMPFAVNEGARNIAGAFAGLPPDAKICPPPRHFWGEAAPLFDDEVDPFEFARGQYEEALGSLHPRGVGRPRS